MKLFRIWLLLAVSVWLLVSFLCIVSMFRAHLPATTLSSKDRVALKELKTSFQQCVKSNGFGLEAEFQDDCHVLMNFPSHTVPKWKDPKTDELEGLVYRFNLCETLLLWEQIRNTSTILTKEYIDALPNGWENYAWKRINKGTLLNNCENKSLCEEKLSLVLPLEPPFFPRQYGRCAIVGNSGDLLKMQVGKEIDEYDAVVRNNGAPVVNYTKYVGSKKTFRLLNRGSAKALDKVAELDGTGSEVLIIKTTVHDTMNRMIKEVPIENPVYLMLGTPLGSSAKGTGLKAVEFALSVCESVDIYGFTVDPDYKEWTRYFSESRGGHTPLQGRAYYQMMECLGFIKIHSPMRKVNKHKITNVPGKVTINNARVVAEKLMGKFSSNGRPFSSCALWRTRESGIEKLPIRKAGRQDGRPSLMDVTFYPMDQSDSKNLLCVKDGTS